MKRFLADERSRAGILIVAASLVGGTGCVTSAVVGHVQAQQNLHDWQARQELENTSMRNAARLGDSNAMTWLGWYQVSGSRHGIPVDAKAGIALLEQAAARPYAPAQYRLGNLLVQGEGGSADPARGLELLKRAATGACAVGSSKQELFGYPAWRVATLLRDGGRYVARDDSQAELWLARSVMHCHYPEAYGLVVPAAAGLSAEQRALKQLAYARLAGRATLPGQGAVSPEQMEEAARQEQRLRQRVRDSEAQYPAPPAPAP